jgi:UDP-GlcNAc:undecaprenyl-phosphate/decaprenyl-phosphate GlcNAc-1-phosphate transferase
MNLHLLPVLLLAAAAFLLAALFFPLVIRLFLQRGWVDKPDHRKQHAKPVPAAGGMAIAAALFGALLLFAPGREFMAAHTSEIVALITLCIVGAWDDQRNISGLMRLGVQLGAGFFVAASGIRLHSFYGIFGIHELPLEAQFIVSAVIYAGVTNAFNLIDGIDGLSGTLAITGMSTLAVLALYTGASAWLLLLLPATAAVIVFLKYNLNPAKVFMGDSGSQMFGFLLAVAGMGILGDAANSNPGSLPPHAAVVAAVLMIPVADSLRVFRHRIRSGLSPFSADRTHLHHWLLQAGNNHTSAVKQILILQLLLIVFTFSAGNFMPITIVLLIQFLMVMLFTRAVKMIAGFRKWKDLVQRSEFNSKHIPGK